MLAVRKSGIVRERAVAEHQNCPTKLEDRQNHLRDLARPSRLTKAWSPLSLTLQSSGLSIPHPEGIGGCDRFQPALDEVVLYLLLTLTGSLNFSQFLDRSINVDRLLQQALLWLHDQEVMRLNRGMSVFRPAMTIRLEPDGNRFQRSDFEPLQIYHDEKTLQIHIMTEYAEKGLQSIADAVRLPLDYFRLPRADFIDRWLSNKRQELSPADDAGVVAQHRGEPEQPGPAGHSDR